MTLQLISGLINTPIHVSILIQPTIHFNFRQGLVEGHKQIVYPVLEWLLNRIPELKKRAYLAKYLVKVDLPPEVAADPDVSEIYEQVSTFVFLAPNA